MKEVRIVERTHPDGRKSFVIQQKHFLFRWWWVDAWINNDVFTTDTFSTLEEAQNNLCYFDGSKTLERVIN